jgi:hypothetical protein
MEITGDEILNRFMSIAPENGLARARLHIEHDGTHLIFFTGASDIQRTRLLTRIGGLLGIAAGLALATRSPWGLAVAAAGALSAVYGPRLIRPVRLLEVDSEQERLLVVQPAAGAGARICIKQIAELRGVYETQGWDPRSVIYAVLLDGTQVPVLIFPGTDEPLAEYACRTLGLLLDLTATYAGPFGGIKICYERR